MTHCFVELFRSIIKSTPLEVFDFGQPLLKAIFSELQTDPLTNSELLCPLDRIMTLNHDKAFAIDFIGGQGPQLCEFFLKCLNSDWRETDFLKNFMDLWKNYVIYFNEQLINFQSYSPIFSKLIQVYKDYDERESRSSFLRICSVCLNLEKFY